MGRASVYRDIHVMLPTGYGGEEAFISAVLSAGYGSRIPDAADFARRNRVLLVESGTGVPIDIVLAGLPYEALVAERASSFEFEEGCSLKTCSAEDLLVLKLFAFRTRDLADAETVAIRQRGRLDWDYIETHLHPLAEVKGQPEIMAACHRLRPAGTGR